MKFLLIAAILAVLFFLGVREYKLRQRKVRIRQSAYGNLETYTVMLHATDYLSLKQLMGKARTFDDRYFYSVSISREFPLQYLEDWVKAEPESPDALLCYGARLLQRSWLARGYGRGESISDEKWQDFFEWLDKTSEVLIKCTEVSPEDPTPWAYLIMVATWRSEDNDVRKNYFDEAIRRDKSNWPAHMHMTIALSEKWGNSNEEMVQFAERVADDAEEGSDLAIILIKAYIEHWKYLCFFEDKEDEANHFIKSAIVRARAEFVYEKSIGSPNHMTSSVTVFARYNASSWFWIVRNKELLGKELNLLGDNIEDIHWSWAGSQNELKAAKQFVNEE